MKQDDYVKEVNGVGIQTWTEFAEIDPRKSRRSIGI